MHEFTNLCWRQFFVKWKSFHLTVGAKVVQELKLSGSNIAKVNGLEEEEDELATEVAEVEGGGGAIDQAGHLHHKKVEEEEMDEMEKKNETKKRKEENEKVMMIEKNTSFMSGARQPGQKPGTRGLVNIRDWMEGIAFAVLLKFSDILPLRESFANWAVGRDTLRLVQVGFVFFLLWISSGCFQYFLWGPFSHSYVLDALASLIPTQVIGR